MQDIDPDLLRAILQGGAESDQLDPEIGRLKALVAQLRENAPNFEMQGAGPMKVAPGWGRALAGAGNGIMQQMNANKMATLQQQQATGRAGQNRSVLDALMKMRGMPTGPGTPGAGGYSPGAPGMDPYAQFRTGMGT